MAKYTITYKCGCTTEMQLFGKSAEREKKIAYYKTIECPHCRALAAQKEAEASGMAILEGSEKQIAWASDIRNTASVFATQALGLAKDKTVVEPMIDSLFSNPQASFWIENRDDLTLDLRSFMTFLVKNFKK